MGAEMLTNDKTAVIVSPAIVKLPSVATATLAVCVEFVMIISTDPVARQLPTGFIAPLASSVWCFPIVSFSGGQQQAVSSHVADPCPNVPIQSKLPRRHTSD